MAAQRLNILVLTIVDPVYKYSFMNKLYEVLSKNSSFCVAGATPMYSLRLLAA